MLVSSQADLFYSLAYMEARLILARLLWRFDFELEDPKQDWMKDQKVRLVWQKMPLMVRLKPVVRS